MNRKTLAGGITGIITAGTAVKLSAVFLAATLGGIVPAIAVGAGAALAVGAAINYLSPQNSFLEAVGRGMTAGALGFGFASGMMELSSLTP